MKGLEQNGQAAAQQAVEQGCGVEGVLGVEKRLLSLSGGVVCVYEAGDKAAKKYRAAARRDV